MISEDVSIVIKVEDTKTFEKPKWISQIALVKERINSFVRKHGCGFEAFEDKIAHSPEDFERWDDFIEWKAHRDSLRDLESKLKKVEDATNFRIASG